MTNAWFKKFPQNEFGKKFALLKREFGRSVAEITKRAMRSVRKRLESRSDEVAMPRDSMNSRVLCTCSSFLSSSIFAH
jgi:hypothetical protein